jgi:hypothetical protein
MCRCGHGQPGVSTRAARIDAAHSVHAPRAVAAPTIRYEYVGHTGLTVFGGATRHRYRFASTGAQVAVDARDGKSLDVVPNLRRVPPPTTS